MTTLERWTRPDHYIGPSWPEHYVFLGQHRDSDALTRSNFECGLKALGGPSDTVIVVREHHWAVGWVEWIAIHQDDQQSLETASEIVQALSYYPVLNDEHFSELEYSEAQELWSSISLSERVCLCSGAGVSVFAARRDHIPHDDTGYILAHLSGY